MSSVITIIGAGAAGLFCASILGQHGYPVRVVDNGKQIGRKILMSGGGRCNFTNYSVSAENYLSANPHFCKSALKRFTQWDFLALINRYQIAYHEREHGQLFCDNSAKDIVQMLQAECHKGQVEFLMQTEVNDVTPTSNGFELQTNRSLLHSQQLIIATGGLSMPALGMTSFAYKLAEKLQLPVEPVRAGLVPLTLHKPLLEVLAPLAGTAIAVTARCNKTEFKESLLFTHRGLSGPAILQISSYWRAGQMISIDLLPEHDLAQFFSMQRQKNSNPSLKNLLAQLLPKRLVEALITLQLIPDIALKQLTTKAEQQLIQQLHQWQIMPNGTEGYRTAEVTLGGISTDVLSSKSMMVKTIPGLFFIGEVVDVSGWLGGYNFQWAWSSAAACANAIIAGRF